MNQLIAGWLFLINQSKKLIDADKNLPFRHNRNRCHNSVLGGHLTKLNDEVLIYQAESRINEIFTRQKLQPSHSMST